MRKILKVVSLLVMPIILFSCQKEEEKIINHHLINIMGTVTVYSKITNQPIPFALVTYTLNEGGIPFGSHTQNNGKAFVTVSIPSYVVVDNLSKFPKDQKLKVEHPDYLEKTIYVSLTLKETETYINGSNIDIYYDATFEDVVYLDLR